MSNKIQVRPTAETLAKMQAPKPSKPAWFTVALSDQPIDAPVAELGGYPKAGWEYRIIVAEIEQPTLEQRKQSAPVLKAAKVAIAETDSFAALRAMVSRVSSAR